MQNLEQVAIKNQPLLKGLDEQDHTGICDVLDELDLYESFDFETFDLIESIDGLPRELE